jgi:mRNA interferase RelE/StbE
VPEYRVELAASASRDLQRLPQAVADAALMMMDGPLSNAPHRVGKPLVAPLQGLFSARCGRDHRIVYKIDEARMSVAIVRVRHRSVAYRP